MSNGHNPVYDRQDPDFESRYIYFYYIRPHGTPRPTVDIYHFARPSALKPTQMATEMSNIVSEIMGPNPPQIRGHEFWQVEWVHTSYFAAVFEGSEKLVADDAFTFRFKRILGYGPNHSFFGGKDITNMGPNLSGFFCVNHMLDEDGTRLGNKKQKFRVTANHGHSHSSVSRLLHFLQYFSHTDTGTNTGPPQP